MQCPKCKTDNPGESVFCAKCGTQISETEEKPLPTQTIEAPREELTTGSTFAGRYQIIEEIGKGGMGKVYKAQDKKIKETVALKLIKPEIASDKKTIERFGNEMKFARKVSHRNVCRMYDLGEEKGSHFITMEYVPGEDLRSSIRRFGQLPIGKSISITKQICEGLAEAHRLGVIHRDLKSNNIMIDKEGNVRIMDFGIARSLEAKGITGPGVMIGTPEYMSPEQVEGKEVDQRSDIYSLGVILYEMVTGRVPFEGDTPFTIGMKHKGEIPKNPKELNTQISDDLNSVILRCLEKEKEKRYQSAGEARSELENIEKGIPTTDRAIPRRKPLTSKEITVTFGLKRLVIPALVVIALITIGVIIWQFLPNKETATLISDTPSVAILPFVDLSPQEDQAYFCDGLADELINRLTKIENLRVPARTSSFSFKGKELSIQEIGGKLDVENVLEGSIRKSGDRLRVSVQLIKVDDGYPIWSERYERNVEDSFALQDEISLAIIDNLKIELLGKEKIEFVKSHTQNIEAYDLYLKGRFFRSKRTGESLKKAVDYLKRAIEIDPSYSLAYAELANSYLNLGGWDFLSSKEAYTKTKEAALRALELDGELAEAHTALAGIMSAFDWDWEGAEKEFLRAIELNPRYPTARLWYSQFKTNMGKFDEALKEIELAIKLDPLSLIINAYASIIYYYSDKHDEAIEQAKKTLEIDPNFRPVHIYLARMYIWKGRYEEALSELELINYKGAITGLAYAKMGRISEAKRVLEDLIRQSQQSYVPNFNIALLYFHIGDIDNGFVFLEKSYEERETLMSELKIHPSIEENVRSDPRFKAMLKKMNLE
ncbi:Serine/threonine-protein kinase PknD [subsurface metagenome]